MEECRACELAVYCYSDSNTWTFRTKQEMEEKQSEMAKCPSHAKAQEKCFEAVRKCSEG